MAPVVPRTAGRGKHARPPRPVPAGLRRAWVSVVPLVLLLLGAEIRIRQWWGARSLWLDEALIARSVVRRDYAELVTEPLLGGQAAPVLWLWATRLSLDLVDQTERALRLVSLLAGLAVLVLAWRLARRLLPDVLVPVAVALVVLSPSLVYFSNEVKPYAVDAAVVLALVLLALRTRTDVRPLALAGAVAVWASFAAVFALAGISVLLVLGAARTDGLRAAGRTAAWLSAWVVSLGTSYVLVLHRLRDSEVLSRFWDHTFPDGREDLPAWFGRRAVDLTHDPLDLAVWPLALLLLACGVWRLVRSHPSGALLALSPVPFAVVAAATSTYPLAERLALWLAPLGLIALAAAVPTRRDRPVLLAIAVAALLTVAGPMAARSLPQTVAVHERNELRPVMEELAATSRAEDLVLVEVAAQAPFDFYRRAMGLERDGVITFATAEEVGGRCNDEAALRAGRFATDRVWVVFGHQLEDTARLGTRADMLARIQDVTNVAHTIARQGAKAVLFDPSAPPSDGSAEPRNPRRCLQVVRTVPPTGS